MGLAAQNEKESESRNPMEGGEQRKESAAEVGDESRELCSGRRAQVAGNISKLMQYLDKHKQFIQELVQSCCDLEVNEASIKQLMVDIFAKDNFILLKSNQETVSVFFSEAHEDYVQGKVRHCVELLAQEREAARQEEGEAQQLPRKPVMELDQLAAFMKWWIEADPEFYIQYEPPEPRRAAKGSPQRYAANEQSSLDSAYELLTTNNKRDSFQCQEVGRSQLYARNDRSISSLDQHQYFSSHNRSTMVAQSQKTRNKLECKLQKSIQQYERYLDTNDTPDVEK